MTKFWNKDTFFRNVGSMVLDVHKESNICNTFGGEVIQEETFEYLTDIGSNLDESEHDNSKTPECF